MAAVQPRAQLPLLPAEPDWQLLDQRERGTAFIAVGSRSILNSPASTHMGFWSINPYIGCEFGCTYCYARDTHRYAVEREQERAQSEGASTPLVSLDELPPWLAFERRILVKKDAAQRLARSLDPARLGGAWLMIGTATDPYQPAERKFRITRSLLEVIAAHRGIRLGIVTKSPLVVRDLDLLRRIAERNSVRVNISLATADARLARRLESRSPVPAARLRALRRISAAGITTGLYIAPILPGITDDRAGLERLFTAARDAGARHIMGSPLRLGPAARARFLPHLEREFPELAARYRKHYAAAESAPEAYRAGLSARLESLRITCGYGEE
jgi:DNA repair photolyase